jgi:polyribonucleotide 5'-hydroxyl-kinase
MASKREWVLAAESELRLEVGENDHYAIQLLEGSAEIFGTEMVLNKEYMFSDENIAVFTWYGCKVVEVSGSCKIAYESSDTPMVAVVNAHALLEAKRDVALANAEKGPRVMIVGPPDSGKSTIARVLACYAVRLDRTPVFVDLDVSKGALAVPGALCGCVLDRSFLNTKDDSSSIVPLSYFYGHASPKANIALYQSLITVMAAKINERMANDPDSSASGMIIDTHAWSDMADLEGILHSAKAFEVDVILVTDDRLYSTLKPNLENSTIVVAKLPRSGGVVTQDATAKRRKRKARIDEYFYGKKVDAGQPTTLSPARVTLRLNNFQFWQMGGLQMHDGIRVHGSSTTSDPLQFIQMPRTRDNLLHSVVAVLHKADSPAVLPEEAGGQASSESSSKNIVSVVAGFLYIVEVDSDKDSAVVLAPCPGALPSKNIVVGSIKWYE